MACPRSSKCRSPNRRPAGTLTILGSFPATQGTVQITDANGAHALPVTTWATNNIVATLPPGGSGSAGAVEVLTSTGQAGNAVPLTQWSGQLTYTENDSIPNLSGQSGSGSGTIEAVFNVVFRADVHPDGQRDRHARATAEPLLQRTAGHLDRSRDRLHRHVHDRRRHEFGDLLHECRRSTADRRRPAAASLDLRHRCRHRTTGLVQQRFPGTAGRSDQRLLPGYRFRLAQRRVVHGHGRDVVSVAVALGIWFAKGQLQLPRQERRRAARPYDESDHLRDLRHVGAGDVQRWTLRRPRPSFDGLDERHDRCSRVAADGDDTRISSSGATLRASMKTWVPGAATLAVGLPRDEFSASIRCAEGAGSSRRASVEERPGSIGQGAG